MEKKVLSCLQYVPAGDIWPGALNKIDEGERDGLLRGYNVEVRMPDGTTGWDSCNYIYGTIEDNLDSEFTKFWFEERGVTPTGRICFRGYAVDNFDDTVSPCDADGNLVEAD